MNDISNGVSAGLSGTLGHMNDTVPEVRPASRAPRRDGATAEPAPAPTEHPTVAEGSRQPPTEVRSLAVVIRAYSRHHVRALMFKRLADLALQEFRGVDGRPPTKLFRLPNGAKFEVDQEDSLELCMDLNNLANEERLKMAQIRDAAVHVAPAVVDIPQVPYVPSVPGENDGDAVDNPGFKVATASPVPKDIANGVARAAKPVKPHEWERAVGVSGTAVPK